MLENMTLEDLHEVSKTLQKEMSFAEMRNAAKVFSQDNGISFYEAVAIVYVSYAITRGASINDIVKIKDRRLRELQQLEKN